MTDREATLEVLRADMWARWEEVESDQKKHLARPPFQTAHPEDGKMVNLIAPGDLNLGEMSVKEAILRRKSRRAFTATPLTLEELSFLLWATQGVHEVANSVYRTVPSAGARHPFETYLLVNRVTDVDPGLYRYLSLEHKLCLLKEGSELVSLVHEASNRQFVQESAVTFVWTAVPYRTEWRYGTLSPKLIALDAGHVGQNLYLAAEAIGAGTCTLGAYDQKKIDEVLEVDGHNELAIYLAPVGKVT